MNRVLMDTGPLVAMISEEDRYHDICAEAMRAIPGAMFSCWPVITEAAWLAARTRNGVRQLLRSLSNGVVELLPLGRSDVREIAQIGEKYADLRPDLADLALVYLAGRDEIDTVFTFDRRDFSIYRVRGRALRIIPDLR